MQQQNKIAEMRNFFVSRGCFNVATLINLLVTPAGCRLKLIGTRDIDVVDVLDREFLTKERAERVWCRGNIAIGGGETDFMPLAWLQQCITFWDELSGTAQSNFDRACGEFTVKYHEQQALRGKLSWVDYYGENIPV